MSRTYDVPPDDAGQRLDRYLRKLLPGATLGHVFKLIRKKRVRVNGAAAAASTRLEIGDVVEIDKDAEDLRDLSRRRGSAPRRNRGGRTYRIDVLFEDEHVAAVLKPRGLAVHGGTGQDSSLVDRLPSLFGASSARTFRPAPAHRLDRETSGILLIGKTAEALRALHEAFREGRVRKRYLALTRGVPRQHHGVIDKSLVRVDDPRGAKMAVAEDPTDENALEARTQFRTLASSRGHALLSVEIATGRTHQIRVHLAAIRAPLIGDTRYGGGRLEAAPSPGFWLHAGRLDFEHPVTHEAMRLRMEPPTEFREVADSLGLRLPHA
ncbi:MAG: RluA family pseudouridine synthase [Planctomycetes bacterium]|nr:RluA family pseudouridine synthase [Planctomycetota bacterium]